MVKRKTASARYPRRLPPGPTPGAGSRERGCFWPGRGHDEKTIILEYSYRGSRATLQSPWSFGQRQSSPDSWMPAKTTPTPLSSPLKDQYRALMLRGGRRGHDEKDITRRLPPGPTPGAGSRERAFFNRGAGMTNKKTEAVSKTASVFYHR